MSLSWIIAFAALLIIPVSMVYAGFMRQKNCNKIGARLGFRTQNSMSSAEMWAFAQKLCPMRYMLTGLIMGVVAIVMMLPNMALETTALFPYAFTLLLLELCVWGIIVITVESALCSKLGVKE